MAKIDDFADSEVVGCATGVADLRNRVGNRCLDATDGRARWIDDCTAYGSPVSLSLPLGEDMPPNSTRIAMTALVRCPLSCVPFLSAAISTSITVSAISSSTSVSVEVLFRTQDRCNPIFVSSSPGLALVLPFSLQKKPFSRDIALIRICFSASQGPIRSFTGR